MPFVDISLARGRSGEYLEAVSRAVHEALVAELRMKPEDQFQLIHQHEPDEMVFDRFYKTLVRLLEEGAGVRPADVFVMMTVTPPENVSFAGGATGTDVAAAEALDAAAKAPGSRETYTKAEMAYAITELLGHRDSSHICRCCARTSFSRSRPRCLTAGSSPARLTNTAVLKATGKTVVFQNAWLFEVASGRLAGAQLYADTAAVRGSAG